MNTDCRELVIKEDKLEYKPIPTSIGTLSKGKDKTDRVAIYKKVRERDEFRRPQTKEVILDEDHYLSYLEEIIQRDYYPAIKGKVSVRIFKQKNNFSQQDHLKAFNKLNEEYEKKFSNPNKKIIDTQNLSVDEYVQSCASDELESLRDILHKDKEKKLRKFLWMYQQEHKHNDKIKALKQYTEAYLSLPDTGDKKNEQSALQFNEVDAKNSLFFDPCLSNKRERDLDLTNPLSLPDLLEKDLSENIKEERCVVKENTRLPENFVENMISLHNQKMKRRLFENYENSDLVKLMKEIKQIDAKRQSLNQEIPPTPCVNGFKLMKEPEPKPGVIDPCPIFTWGEIDSTPNILEQRKFSVPQTPVRDVIAQSLVNKITKKKVIKE